MTYLLLWILYDGIEEQEGAGYLVFFTIWGYILLIIGLVAMTIASFVHTIVGCINPKLIESRIPQYSELEPKESYFQQDHTPWYLKIAWMLYVFGVVPSLPIVFVYWVFVGNNVTVTAENVHLHGLNFLFALLDILISRVPIQLFHFYLIMLFGVVYTVFQAIFFAAGGTNPNDGGNYVYQFIDFGTSPGSAVGFCLLLIFVGAVIHMMFFGIAQARDQIAKCIPRCYWNVKSIRRDLDDQPIDMLREAWLITPPSVSGRDNKDSTTPHHTYLPDKMADNSNSSDNSIRSSPSGTQV